MVRNYISLCIAIVAIGFAGAQAEAGGRGQRSSVCTDAGLIGAAYGACNVYCEALDCDGVDPNGSGRACDKALDRFIDLTGELPPCENACPCAAGWLDPSFMPTDPVSYECMYDVTDQGASVFLSIDGGMDEMGQYMQVVAMVDIFDDDAVLGYHRSGCGAERVIGGELTEDSSVVEITGNFTTAPMIFKEQQTGLFESCMVILTKVIEENNLECQGIE